MVNETIADIIAEIRALSNPISDGIIAINGRRIADRLEAAHRREAREAVTGSNQLGDAAKLREALEEARKVIKPMYWAKETLPIIDAALAAPPRNCEMFSTVDEVYKAWDDYLKKHPELPPSCKTSGSIIPWLFAPATEKEGGNDGNK